MTDDDGGEGTAGGDCRDGADNDDDGLFDCDDDGCGASPDCEGSDENAAPSGATIAIEPATPGDDDDLVCTIVTEATDPNGDPVSYTFAWARSGADAGVSGATVGAALTSGGDTWTCTVIPNDGALDGAPASASVTIAQGNRAPSAPTVSISPAAPTDDDVLTCVIDTESVDPDGDTVTYAYAWSVDGADAGVSSATVNAALTEAGQTWTCGVTASDGELESGAGTAGVEIAAVLLGSDRDHPGASCLEILEAGSSTGDGRYWLDLGGTPSGVRCDMTTAGGGWTVIFVASDLDYDSTSINYDLDAEDLLLTSSEALIGFVRSDGFGVTDWASMELPEAWRSASPMSFEARSENRLVALESGGTVNATLYYGYSNFDSNCGDWQDASTSEPLAGRIGFCTGGAPYWAGFSRDVEPNDYCNAWAGSWEETACSEDRRFAIYAR